MRECCICSSDVEAVGKSRCKRLHGPSCLREKEYLNKITTEWHGVSLADVKDISQNPDAIICYSCVQKLVKCDKIEKELHKLTQDFVQCLGKLLNVTAGTDEASQGRLKRSTPKSAYR